MAWTPIVGSAKSVLEGVEFGMTARRCFISQQGVVAMMKALVLVAALQQWVCAVPTLVDPTHINLITGQG